MESIKNKVVPPVLFLIFNRPYLTEKIFEVIKKVKPKELFIAADGPRKTHYNDEELCKQARAIATDVDWDCKLHTLFRDENLGSGIAVHQAINWFFEHADRGIILEDDCLPDETFFDFCQILLDAYADREDIMSISGTNLLPNGWKSDTQSYHFGHGGIWGWATWKRAWNKFTFDIPAWQSALNKKKIRKSMSNRNWFNYFSDMFDDASQQRNDIWDLQWFYCILNNNAMAINPSVNLVKNIGFGPGATHTSDADSPYAKLEIHHMKFPVKHPQKTGIDREYLKKSYHYISNYNKTFIDKLKQHVRPFLKYFKLNTIR